MPSEAIDPYNNCVSIQAEETIFGSNSVLGKRDVRGGRRVARMMLVLRNVVDALRVRVSWKGITGRRELSRSRGGELCIRLPGKVDWEVGGDF